MSNRRPGDPLTQQRSEWMPRSGDDDVLRLLRLEGCTDVAILWRHVHDGDLRAIRSCDPPDHAWHLSISHWPTGLRANRRARRYPSWDELAHARYELLPANIDVVMHLPPPSEYVSVEDTTFHLHEHRPVASEPRGAGSAVDAPPVPRLTTGGTDDLALAPPIAADS